MSVESFLLFSVITTWILTIIYAFGWEGIGSGVMAILFGWLIGVIFAIVGVPLIYVGILLRHIMYLLIEFQRKIRTKIDIITSKEIILD